jgi:hypothetical protein
MSKPKSAKVDTSAQDAALAMQRVQQAQLDEEENRRRKRFLSAATGLRAFAGSALFRRAPSNTPGPAVANAVRPAPRSVAPSARSSGSARNSSMIQSY